MRYGTIISIQLATQPTYLKTVQVYGDEGNPDDLTPEYREVLGWSINEEGEVQAITNHFIWNGPNDGNLFTTRPGRSAETHMGELVIYETTVHYGEMPDDQ